MKEREDEFEEQETLWARLRLLEKRVAVLEKQPQVVLSASVAEVLDGALEKALSHYQVTAPIAGS